MFLRSQEGNRRGSSPRGRGKQGEGLPVDRLGGLIPARAGKTLTEPLTPVGLRAHPRAGGENVAVMVSRRSMSGSSPRGRGKLRAELGLTGGPRLIPARAGKTPSPSLSTPPATAHPRAGGENHQPPHAPQTAQGSSPRGRGKPRQDRRAHQRRRLIPARAGKTTGRRAASATDTAHPRAGGENFRRPATYPPQSGSSPRGRGKRLLTLHPAALARLIPARAGKTMVCSFVVGAAGAHPRAGGENTF